MDVIENWAVARLRLAERAIEAARNLLEADNLWQVNGEVDPHCVWYLATRSAIREYDAGKDSVHGTVAEDSGAANAASKVDSHPPLSQPDARFLRAELAKYVREALDAWNGTTPELQALAEALERG